MGDYSKNLSRRIRGKTLGGLKFFLSGSDEFHAARNRHYNSAEIAERRPMTGYLSTMTEAQKARALRVGAWPDLIPVEFPIVVPPHPDKYPKHEGSKGSVFNGVCNRTACDSQHAQWFNRGTRGYYCGHDARGINQYSGNAPLCIVVDHDLTHEEMNTHHDEMMREMRP